MNLVLLRNRFGSKQTIGQLYIENDFFCFTLEDRVREIEGVPVEKWKVAKETAIPYGLYQVTLENSPKFGPDTPTINKVPGFQYIRMHAGNTEGDTEGCILLGFRLNEEMTALRESRQAVTEFKQRLRGQKEITINIIPSPHSRKDDIDVPQDYTQS